MGFWNALAAFGGQMMNNYNINRQLSFQAAENEKNRQYNLNLAKMQNQWNIQQWNNENAYNSPSAQMERMKQAGLNPDMMYGGGVSGNLAANSPQMTSGAPSSPMDWSALSNKKTIAQAAAESLSLEQMRANIRKTNAEAGIEESDLSVRDKLNELGIEASKLENEKLEGEIERLMYDARKISTEADIAAWKHDIQKRFAEKEAQLLLRKLAAETNVSESDAKFHIETLADRIAGISAETTSLKWAASYTNSEWAIVIDLLKHLLPHGSDLVRR